MQNSKTSISAQEIKICDLKSILEKVELNSEKKDQIIKETNLQFLSLEIQRRMRRIERLVKGAPYAGGPFIVPTLAEARQDLDEVEKIVKLFHEKLGEEYCEKFDEKAEQLRSDAKEVEYDSDLI